MPRWDNFLLKDRRQSLSITICRCLPIASPENGFCRENPAEVVKVDLLRNAGTRPRTVDIQFRPPPETRLLRIIRTAFLPSPGSTLHSSDYSAVNSKKGVGPFFNVAVSRAMTVPPLSVFVGISSMRFPSSRSAKQRNLSGWRTASSNFPLWSRTGVVPLIRSSSSSSVRSMPVLAGRVEQISTIRFALFSGTFSTEARAISALTPVFRTSSLSSFALLFPGRATASERGVITVNFFSLLKSVISPVSLW